MPYLAAVRAPASPAPLPRRTVSLDVATYNVHRWTGPRGGRRFKPELAAAVIQELDADVVALQEVLRPFEGDDPLEQIADELCLHLAFGSTRVHRRGELGNAILSRRPLMAAFTLDLSSGRLERRSALAAQLQHDAGPMTVVATHLGLVDRSRARQVRSLLEHPQLQGPVLLLGDMNAWRRCRATRQLDREFSARHHNREWPPSFPAARPVLALDRVYARGVQLAGLRTHSSRAARAGSDHLPVIASVKVH